MGTADEQPHLNDEEHAAGAGVEREHPEVNRAVGHGPANPTLVDELTEACLRLLGVGA